MFKKLLVLSTLAITAATFTGCGSSTTTPTENTTTASSMNATELYAATTKGFESSDELMELDAEALKDYYNIDVNLLESFKVTMPYMTARMSEIAVFELKNEADVDTILANIEKRASDAGISLYPSLEETYAGRQTVVEGKNILFVMDSNAAAMVENFKNALN